MNRSTLLTLKIFILTTILLSACSDDKNTVINPPPSGSDISYQNGTITVQNATIIFKGQSYTGSAQIPPNSIVGILRDTTPYLYHTSIGNANLNEETSKRAVGYFLFDTTNLMNDINLTLGTGLKITGIAPNYTITNLKRRWASVAYQNTVKYLAQRGDFLDIDFVRALSGGNLIDVLSTSSSPINVDDSLSTYGSSIRLVTIPRFWPQLYQKNVEAIKHGADPLLLSKVNAVDFLYYVVKVLNALSSFSPPIVDCAATFTTDILTETVINGIISLITNENRVPEFYNSIISAIISFETCLQKTVVGVRIIKKFLTIFSTFSFILDDVIISPYEIANSEVFSKFPEKMIFAGTSGNGIYRSENDGANWIPVNNGLPNNSFIYELVISDNNIFAGLNQPYGVYLSQNNGTNWSPANTGLPINVTLNALAASNNKVIVAFNVGVFFSQNNGNTWIPSNNGLPLSKSTVASLAINGNNLFVGFHGSGFFQQTGLYHSQNNGVSWNLINNGLPDSTSVLGLSIAGNRIVAILDHSNVADSTHGGVYISNNNGASWVKSNSGLPRILNLTKANSSDSNRIFISNSFYPLTAMYSSFNGGTSWSQVSGLPPYEISDLFVKGSNIFASSFEAGVIFSSNSGQSWFIVNNGLPNNSIRSIAIK